jgi:hypothetical protein
MTMSKAQETMSGVYDWRLEPIHETELATIQSYADRAGLDTDAASEQMFRVPASDLTFQQGQQLSNMMLDAAIQKELAERRAQHHHRCFDCSGRVECFRKDCDETTGHCGACREGMSRNDYARQQARVWGGFGKGW